MSAPPTSAFLFDAAWRAAAEGTVVTQDNASHGLHRYLAGLATGTNRAKRVVIVETGMRASMQGPASFARWATDTGRTAFRIRFEVPLTEEGFVVEQPFVGAADEPHTVFEFISPRNIGGLRGQRPEVLIVSEYSAVQTLLVYMLPLMANTPLRLFEWKGGCTDRAATRYMVLDGRAPEGCEAAAEAAKRVTSAVTA